MTVNIMESKWVGKGCCGYEKDMPCQTNDLFLSLFSCVLPMTHSFVLNSDKIACLLGLSISSAREKKRQAGEPA